MCRGVLFFFYYYFPIVVVVIVTHPQLKKQHFRLPVLGLNSVLISGVSFYFVFVLFKYCWVEFKSVGKKIF